MARFEWLEGLAPGSDPEAWLEASRGDGIPAGEERERLAGWLGPEQDPGTVVLAWEELWTMARRDAPRRAE